MSGHKPEAYCNENGCRYKAGHFGPHSAVAAVEVKPGFPLRLQEPGHGKYVLMTCEFAPCDSCARLMIPRGVKDRERSFTGRMFPAFEDFSLTAQMQRGDLVFESSAVSKTGEPICEVCQAAGKATFVCALCKEDRASTEIQDSFGDPAEHLCKVCYETKPAKIWDERVEELEAAHRWDHE